MSKTLKFVSFTVNIETTPFFDEKPLRCHDPSHETVASDTLSHSSQCSTTGNKGRGMWYPVFGMVHIKESLLLIGKSSPCGGSRFPLSLSEWSFTICPTPYNRKQNVLNASLNKTFPSLRSVFSLYFESLTLFTIQLG